MNGQLSLLVELQTIDGKIAELERTLADIPRAIEALQAEGRRARQEIESLRAKLDAVRKDIRAKEKDLDFQTSKQSKAEAKLFEVKTNKEYSAVLSEIEGLKQEKGKLEEEILALMEMAERIGLEIAEAESRLKVRGQELAREEGALSDKQGVTEAQRGDLQAERAEFGSKVEAFWMGQYQRLSARYRGSPSVVQVQDGTCGGCHVGMRPQRYNEVRQGTDIFTCESCGRILYWIG